MLMFNQTIYYEYSLQLYNQTSRFVIS